MERRVLVAVWVTLPLSAGGAVAEALDGWSRAPEVLAAILCWTAWALALLGLLVPRPVGLTVARVVAPLFAVVALLVLAAGRADPLPAGIAAGTTLVAAVLVARPAVALAAANGIAYGDEIRFPLRVPPALFLGPLPVARLALGAAIASGPLLLADARYAAGAAAIVVGLPVALLTGRALHALSMRWAVLVPAGLVVVDPLTLSDPVLLHRDRIVAMRATGPVRAPGGEALDLRLGATLGSVAITLDRPVEVFRATHGRRGAHALRTHEIHIAVLERDQFLDCSTRRRLRVVGREPVQAATPPPTSTSPS